MKITLHEVIGKYAIVKRENEGKINFYIIRYSVDGHSLDPLTGKNHNTPAGALLEISRRKD